MGQVEGWTHRTPSVERTSLQASLGSGQVWDLPTGQDVPERATNQPDS